MRAVPALRGVAVWGLRLLVVLYFAAALLILAGRHFLMPELAAQRDLVEQKLSAAIGLPVRIAALSASWPGLHPRLVMEGLQIHDREGRPALTFDSVAAEIGWSSLWRFGMHLHRLEIKAPALDIRRDAAGTLFVAGLPVRDDGEGGFADWLLEQSRIVVRDARLVWHDEWRGAPPLELRELNFELRNFGRHHSFGLRALPPAHVAGRIDVRGNLVGRALADPASWRGELFADLAQADLAAWTPWLDLPLEWSRGHGSLRVWLEFANLAATAFTVDLRLADAAVRLRPDLAILDLAHLDGRLTGRRAGDGYAGEIRRLTLATRDGIVLPPTDARLAYDGRKGRESGEFGVSELDLGALAALAGHLPLPADVHERLRSFDPRGRLSAVELSWRGTPEAPAGWRVKGRFDGLRLSAWRELPGFAGISGSVEGDAEEGEIRIDSRDATIDLPTVFPEPQLALASLEADIGWRTGRAGTDFLLSRIAFRNDDASGEAAGSYRHTGAGPGEIDLSAKLTQAAGNAVWRYMPLVVNQDARDWLRAGIVGGRSETASLRLKGPLDRFPFRDGKGGIFQVKGTIQGATLKFAPGWPEMTGIDGDLLFEGVRMVIRGQRADIMGVKLAEVRAEIPDLDASEETLLVTGRASGPTQRFLDFVEASPVGARIDHFTQPMTATGNGELELKLTMPLRHVADTRVDGRYRFTGNQLRVLPFLPLLDAAQGEFAFDSDKLQAKNLRARFLDAPVAVDVATAAGGAVRISAAGTLTAQGLRRQTEFGGQRVFEHLSGESAWRAVVTVKKPGAEVRIESTLEGLASSLPEPFNKSGRTALPLKVSGRVDPNRDEWTATLGEAAQARLQQAGEQWRGRIAFVAANPAATKSAALSLPERGVALEIAQPSLDVDAWRALLAAPANGNGATSSPAAASLPPLAGIDIKAAEMRLLGRDFHEVKLAGARQGGKWQVAVDSREAQGKITWEDAGRGRLGVRLSRLLLPSAVPGAAATETIGEDGAGEMPAIDLVIDDFRLRDLALGEVRVAAENRDGAWEAKLAIANDAAKLNGEGRWRPSRVAPETVLDFKLDVEDAERLLGRLGMPDAVRRGAGTIEGELTWNGAPSAFDLPSLSGRLKADIGKGQFKKLEPGVGRLLGVLSLQSLPRRITLDFRDIFSEGFAFDSITGAASVTRGQMSTENLQIRGPAAKILLSGQANLVAETQDLHVRVQPSVGETVATGAMLVNPVVGAVAWLAQKALNDPLDQAFAYEYAVTGKWSDPKVDKIEYKIPETRAATP
ncbi:MAG: YhdP family protein [Pseudomonadota bacterium]